MPHGGCIFWYTRIYLYKYDYVIDFNLMVMLRSTTGPYGRPVIEVVYGKMIFSLHRGCMGDDSSGRVIGVSAWCIVHVWHTRVNTNVGTMYVIFWFSNMWIFNVMFWWCHEMAYKYAVYIYIWNKDDMRKWFYGDDYVVLRAPMDDLL